MQTEMTYHVPTRKSGIYAPTKEDVVALWHHFMDKYDTKLIDKDDDALMKFISMFLGMSKNMTKDDFIKSYVTTLGDRIYIPFELGVINPDGRWNLWSQLVTGIHEHQHVMQYNAEDTKGKVDFSTQYLLKKRRRARFEIEAYTTSLEMHFWRYGQTRSIDGLITALKGYMLDPEDFENARDVFTRNNKMIAQGAIITEASSVAIEWFRSRGVLPASER